MKLGYRCGFESQTHLDMMHWLIEQTEAPVQDALWIWQVGDKVIDMTTARKSPEGLWETKAYANSIGVTSYFRTRRYTGNGWLTEVKLEHPVNTLGDGFANVISNTHLIEIEDEMIAIQFKLVFPDATSIPYVRYYK